MAKAKADLTKHWDTYAILHREKALIAKHYPRFKFNLTRTMLRCIYAIPSPTSDKLYKTEITYTPPMAPKVHILDPPIEMNKHTHVYADDSLCLYYPGDLSWSYGTHHIYDKIIPWIAEWIVYYELYRHCYNLIAICILGHDMYAVWQ
ncbi:hypothetical protein, partial [Hymenobacter coalescens]